MNDLYGYTRNNPGQHLISADYAAIYFAHSTTRTNPADRLGLVQSAAVSYQHRVDQKFEAGSSEMFWITGQPSGVIAVGRLIGDKGFLNGIPTNAVGQGPQNGVLGNIEFKAGSSSASQDVLTFGGSVLSQVAWSTSTGSLEISEALTIQISTLASKHGWSAYSSGGSGSGGFGDTMLRVADVLGGVSGIAGAGANLAGGIGSFANAFK